MKSQEILHRIIDRLFLDRRALYRFVPASIILRRSVKKFLKSTNKHQIEGYLNNFLGDFSDFRINCEEEKKIYEQANILLDHKFDLLGSGEITLNPIDWHKDFKSGFSWEKGKFFTKYKIIDLSNSADVKVPWELSRFHHALVLGQAYLLTEDEKYVKEFKSQIENWIDENPLMKSINWTLAMEVSIRAVNWIYALNMFIKSPLIDMDFLELIYSSLYEHGFFIYNNLEKGFPYSGNHYASNIVGLLFLGVFFKKQYRAEHWFQNALKEYYREVRLQILPSGVHFERSTAYHRLMLELFYYSFLMLRRNEINIPFDIKFRIETMFQFVLYYLKPNGNTPLIGDNDDGRILPFMSYGPRDHRYLLSLASTEFNNSPYNKYSIGYTSDVFFLQNLSRKEFFESIQSSNDNLSSKVFKDAGFCIVRDEEVHMFINNSGPTKYPDHVNEGGAHTHADLLSFELYFGKTSFLVDPGTYVYTSDPVERNKFRSTEMHNTVTIDNQSQSEISDKNIFLYNRLAYPVLFALDMDTDLEIFRGSHNGYIHLNNPVIHERILKYNKTEKIFNVIDNFNGEGTHKFQWNFHLGLDVKCDLSPNNSVVCKSLISYESIVIKFRSEDKIDIRIEESYFSPSYGIKKKSEVVKVTLIEECPRAQLFDIVLFK